MISKELLKVIRKEYKLRWEGIHGASHWARVCENGLRLSESTSANRTVIELFAYLHDSKRLNNGFDLGHGKRAAELIKTLRGSHITLPEEEFEHLLYACEYHSDGLTVAHVTVQTCWDADRLDLGRIGIRPKARYLCTPAAKEQKIIDWAFRRSQVAGAEND